MLFLGQFLTFRVKKNVISHHFFLIKNRFLFQKTGE